MDQVMRFGLGATESYKFTPKNQTEYQDNFSNIMQSGVRVVGKDGVVTPYGLGRGPAESGNVSIRFWVFGDDIYDTGQQISQIRGLGYLGLRRLFKLHSNGELMWTWASVSSVTTAQTVRRSSHLRQQVQVTFQCPETRWYGTPGMYFLDDELLFGDGLSFPPLKLDQEAVSNGSTVTVTNRGNAPVSAYVRWEGNGTDSFTNPVLVRKNWLGETVNSLTYTATIGANDVVEIDARSYSVTSRNALTALSGDWLTIPAGSWTLTVSGTFTSTGLLSIDFWDGWV